MISLINSLFDLTFFKYFLICWSINIWKTNQVCFFMKVIFNTILNPSQTSLNPLKSKLQPLKLQPLIHMKHLKIIHLKLKTISLILPSKKSILLEFKHYLVFQPSLIALINSYSTLMLTSSKIYKKTVF